MMSINLRHYNNEAAFELDLKKKIAKRKMEGNLYNIWLQIYSWQFRCAKEVEFSYRTFMFFLLNSWGKSGQHLVLPSLKHSVM